MDEEECMLLTRKTVKLILIFTQKCCHAINLLRMIILGLENRRKNTIYHIPYSGTKIS